MLNYVQHRAIFEGMNAHLWAPNSGRMLWMTQPAWPSNDVANLQLGLRHAGFLLRREEGVRAGARAAGSFELQCGVVNTTNAAQSGLTVTANVYSLDNKSLLHREENKDAAANTEVDAFTLDLATLFGDGVVLVKLELQNAVGQPVSDNFYWLGAKTSSLRALNKLPAAKLAATATSTQPAMKCTFTCVYKTAGRRQRFRTS